MQQAGREIHLLPAERHQLADTEAVAVGQHEQRRVPVAVPATPARGRDEPLDFGGRQVFATSERRVRQPSRWNCPVYGYWSNRSGNP